MLPVFGAETFTGRCHCGSITWEAMLPVVKASDCDCQGCSRATSTMAAPFVTVKPKAFKITKGEVKTYKAKGGKDCDAHGTWHFCGDCGSQVYWKPKNGKQIDIFAGTLDDRSIYAKNLKKK